MKKLFNLAALLRRIFWIGQLLTVIIGCVWITAFFISLAPRTGPVSTLTFEDVILEFPIKSIGVKTPTSSAEDIRIMRFTTALKLNLHSTDPELANAIRWTLLPQFLLSFVAWLLTFSLLRTLCVRVESGEVFSEANLRSVRNLGRVLVTWSLVDGALCFWTSHHLGGYLARQGTLTGLNATLLADSPIIGKLPVNDLVTGLLVLILAEAFRQGLALKKENDLTV